MLLWQMLWYFTFLGLEPHGGASNQDANAICFVILIHKTHLGLKIHQKMAREGKLRFKKNFTTYLKMVFLVTRIPHKWFYKSFLFSTKTSSKGKAKAERMWQIKRKIPQMSSPNCKIVLYSDKNLFHHFSSCCIAAHHFIQWFLKIPAFAGIRSRYSG